MPENAAVEALSAIASPLRPQGEGWPVGAAPLWDWFRPGHVLELSSTSPGEGPSARTSVAADLTVRAQAEGEPVAWVDAAGGLYPPDLAAVGVDLTALVVVQPPRPESAVTSGPANPSSGVRDPRRVSAPRGQAIGAVRAAEVLLRSGAFGLVVLDLSQEVPKGALTWLARLHGLLRLHEARLLVLTGTEAASLGPLVSLRVAPRSRRLSADRWAIEHTVLKSKLGAAVDIRADVRAAPAGASGVAVGPRLSKLPPEVSHGQGQATERCA